jgi:hypothetical protein
MFQFSLVTLLLFGAAILVAFLLLIAAFWLAYRYTQKEGCLSPYSGMPLRRGSELSYYSVERVLRYLYELQDYNNPMFDLRTSAVCRETGRIFPRGINWLDTISVDWDFLQKRKPGKYVSWGSLSKEQQEYVQEIHGSMEGYQVEFSSQNPLPRAIEPKYTILKPGPLYVDIDSYVLLGWKVVPDTDLEVMIVQWPRFKKRFHFTPIVEEET